MQENKQSGDGDGLHDKAAASARAASSPATATGAIGSLCKDIAEFRVVLVFVYMVDSDMPCARLARRLWWKGVDMCVDLPLEVVWSRVAVVSVGAERADVARRFVDQTVPDHLVFALEPLAAFAARATRDRAVVGPCRGVHVGVRVEQVLCLEWLRGAAGNLADVAPGWDGHAVDAHPVETRRRAGWM